ncbi:glycosyltransferase [Rhizobium halophilum]|uniref:glycosyltransferase n=1 Tax=Rhizobium halophilum TaxID=2846852 RepID=UPI001EFD851D|nr:glycosyltransferase [Rhizobium halophilum]MCF6369489.1 glycosyltransferase [Rhizobium halophilum]
MAVGTIEPRKNYLWLARQWMRFCDLNPALVEHERLTIFGRKGWLPREELALLERMAQVSGKILLQCGASDKDLEEAIVSSRACISAAHEEGWGMPLAEALAMGTPVLASNIEAHRESTQGLAAYFNLDGDKEFQKVLTSCFSPQDYQQLLDRTAKFVPWSWDAHFLQLTDLLVQHRPSNGGSRIMKSIEALSESALHAGRRIQGSQKNEQ